MFTDCTQCITRLGTTPTNLISRNVSCVLVGKSTYSPASNLFGVTFLDGMLDMLQDYANSPRGKRPYASQTVHGRQLDPIAGWAVFYCNWYMHRESNMSSVMGWRGQGLGCLLSPVFLHICLCRAFLCACCARVHLNCDEDLGRWLCKKKSETSETK